MGAKLLGSDKHDILHLPFSTFVVKENWDLFSGHLRKVFDRQIRQIQELRLRTARLSMRHVQLQSAMVVNSTDPVSCRTAVIDITERKHAEEALRDTNENLQAQKEQLQSVNELLRVRQEELTEANEHLRTQELESARQARRAMTDQSAPHKANAGWHRQSLRL
jgi:PAS domain S-box-containing protein